MTWKYNIKTRKYEDAEGSVLSVSDMVGLRDAFSTSRKASTEALAQSLAEGKVILPSWVMQMREEIRIAHIDLYVLARGGRDSVTPAEWGTLGSQLRQQYTFLNGFADAIKNETLTESQIIARAALYMDASVRAYEQGRTAAAGIPRLSQYPADGKTACGVKCRCTLDITEDELHWYVRWVLGPVKKEHCADCTFMANLWNPLVIPKVAA